MGDLIDRQDAIEAIEAKEVNEFGNHREYNVAFNDGLRSAVFALEELPSAERVGHWIFNPIDAIELMFAKPKCSECGSESADGGNYCPNCGAKMEGEEE